MFAIVMTICWKQHKHLFSLHFLPMKKTLVRRFASLTVAVFAIVAVVVLSQHKSEDIPLPFYDSTDSSLAGDLTKIGRKTVDVYKVSFPAGVNEETLSQDTIYLVYTPSDASLVTMDEALAINGVHSVNYFGYRYQSMDAAVEKANRNDPLLVNRFPGQFFASAKARQEDPQHNSGLATFEAANGVTMVDTETFSGATLLPDTLYFLIVNEATPVTMSVRNLVNCGNLVREGAEQCDDGNADDTDACRNSCMLAVCRDGVIQTNVEECDDGNTNNTDTCTNACTTARCGDAIVEADVEQCHDGNQENEA